MPLQSSKEIEAKAERMLAEARTLSAGAEGRKAAAQRTYDQDVSTADRVIAAAGAAGTDAQAALHGAATNARAAEASCNRAAVSLANAAALAGRPGGAGSTSDSRDEWKECRFVIDRFDKILVDLRKTGASFVTAIIGGAAFLLSRPPTAGSAGQPAGAVGVAASVADLPLVKFAVFVVIAALIMGLYVIDRVHQAWLRAAVDRAKVLERELGFTITQELSSKVEGWLAATVGMLTYIILLFASALVFVFGLETGTGPGGALTWNQLQIYTVIGFAIGSLLVFVSTAITSDERARNTAIAMAVIAGLLAAVTIFSLR